MINERLLVRAKRKNWNNIPEEQWWAQGTAIKMYINNEKNTPHHFIIPGENDLSPEMKISNIIIEVEENTISQSIGFKDRYKGDIYENMILSREIYGHTIKGVITWRNIGICGFYLMFKNPDGITSYYSMGRGQYDNDTNNKCNDVILGNMFDNLDLLEVT